jgi:hypothetical protein
MADSNSNGAVPDPQTVASKGMYTFLRDLRDY